MGKKGGMRDWNFGRFSPTPTKLTFVRFQGGLFGDVVKEKEGKKTEEQEEEEAEETPPKEKSRPRTKSGKAVPSGGVSIFGGETARRLIRDFFRERYSVWSAFETYLFE